MKNNYIIAILFSFALFSMNAQFTDDMESYTNGSPISGGHWTDWGCGGGPGCAIMSSDAQAHSGTLSGHVPTDNSTDAVLDLGNKISGQWGLSFWMYIPAHKEGYFNIQGVVPVGTGEFIVGDIHFNKDNLDPGMGFITYSTTDTGDDTFFSFPHDAWFQVVINVDLDPSLEDATWEFKVAGNVAVPAGTPFEDGAQTAPTHLGGIDFYSVSDTFNDYYIDDIVYQDSFIGIGVNELEEFDFSMYPNPVQDQLNLQANTAISNVEIYSVLGQKVYASNESATNLSIDTSNFANGAYIVKVTIDGKSESMKIIK